MSDKQPIKIPKTFEEQVDILKSRGLQIQDEARAINILSRVNYYRLSAYWLTYQVDNRFCSGASFECIYRLYEFDKCLRNLLLTCLETIEVAFRTQIAYTIAHTHGALGYMEADNFENPSYHADMMEEIEKQVGRSRELFVQHHREKYNSSLPIWAVVEIMSFGSLSRMYSNLNTSIGKEVAEVYYGLSYGYVKNWLHALSIFRNICAHYGRLYNKTLAFKPNLLRRDKKRKVKNDSVFAVLLVISRLIDDDQWHSTVTQLSSLIDSYSEVDIIYMGFPPNWQEILMAEVDEVEDEVASARDA